MLSPLSSVFVDPLLTTSRRFVVARMSAIFVTTTTPSSRNGPDSCTSRNTGPGTSTANAAKSNGPPGVAALGGLVGGSVLCVSVIASSPCFLARFRAVDVRSVRLGALFCGVLVEHLLRGRDSLLDQLALVLGDPVVRRVPVRIRAD